jgi:lysine-specific demethylase 8
MIALMSAAPAMAEHVEELSFASIPRAAGLTSDAFQELHVEPGRPVILTDLSDAWPARSRWTPEWFRENYGSLIVPIARLKDGRHVLDPKVGLVHESMPLADFMAGIDQPTSGALTAPMENLPAALQGDAPFPPITTGAPWRASKLWVSPAGTKTRLHRDLPDNLNAQIRGRKRFTLVKPSESRFVYSQGFLSSVPNVSLADPEKPDFHRFPLLRQCHPLTGTLEPGDTIYIPRGWWHAATALEPSISINFWWARGPRAALVAGSDLFKRIRGISR